MTEDASPENLRKFLESDDPALIQMGLSMAKGSGVPDDLLGEILWMYMFHDDKTIRAAAKSTFIKLAPEDAKQVVKENWKANYRTARWDGPQVGILERALCQTSVSIVERIRDEMEEYKIKDLLIEWLQIDGKYSRLESINDINNSTIDKKGDEITITYENGVQDIVEIKDGKVIHLDPYQSSKT